ncbi:potassium channel family protein [Streptacidiphilus sp. MAP5-3]|uniref:potassium channel family protein n=1 Tax=unclassified Streptacidiphilus TaxID=2643834 RepID=UPI003514CF43
MGPTRFGDLPPRRRRRLIIEASLRTTVTVAAVVAAYFLIPMGHAVNAVTVTELVLSLLALLLILGWQLRSITQSDHPGIRALEALSVTFPVFILLFATTYFLMSQAHAEAFGRPLTRVDAMYFSTTVFTTVGFGDITARTQPARILVTIQMVLDLVVLGVVVRLVINAVKIGQRRTR